MTEFSNLSFGNKIDCLIRLFFYVMMFWIPYSTAVIESCVITAVLLWVFKRIVQNWSLIKNNTLNILKAFKPPATNLNRLIFYFLVICSVSVATSILWQAALADLITKILEWFAVFWLIQESFKSKKQIYLLLGICIFTASATACDAIIQFTVLGRDIFHGYPVSPDGRATAGFSAPGGLGTYLATVIPVTLSLMFAAQRKIYKCLLFFVLGLMVWSLMLTFTRGAWTGAFVGVLVFFFSYMLRQKHFETAKTISLGLVFLIVIAVFPLLLNAQTTLKLIKRSNTVAWRINIWKDSWKMVEDRPLFGHGVNTYMRVFQSYRRDPHNHPTYAHNCYVQLAAEVGLLGLGVFLWIFVKFFLEGYKQSRKIERKNKKDFLLSVGLLASIVGFLVHSFFDTNIYALQLGALLWFFTGIQTKTNQMFLERE